MSLVTLSDWDLDEVYSLFSQFHTEYIPFFSVQTKNVAFSAKDDLQGQGVTRQQMNMQRFCREVEESEYEAMQHCISSSRWSDKELIVQLQSDVCDLIGSACEGSVILDESGIPKHGEMSVGGSPIL